MQLKEDEAQFYREQEEFKQRHAKSWEVDIEEKRRLQKMLPDKEYFQNLIMERRATEFAALKVMCQHTRRLLFVRREQHLLSKDCSNLLQPCPCLSPSIETF